MLREGRVEGGCRGGKVLRGLQGRKGGEGGEGESQQKESAAPDSRKPPQGQVSSRAAGRDTRYDHVHWGQRRRRKVTHKPDATTKTEL